jgi:hypothetical protein
MANKANQSWNLQAFLDSLIFELDKAQDTLSVKGLNRKLTYMVKDMNLELQLFPEFDGDTVRFTTAKPGDTGASKISLQLGSIRDTQIHEVARPPLTHDETPLEKIGLPEPQQRELKRLGIHSAEDLKRTVKDRNINLEKVTNQRVDYGNLARAINQSRYGSPNVAQAQSQVGLTPHAAFTDNLTHSINQSRRRQHPPSVFHARICQEKDKTILILDGDNLAIAQSHTDFPSALLNDRPIPVLSASPNQLQLQVDPTSLQGEAHQLQVALDPYAVFTMNLQT